MTAPDEDEEDDCGPHDEDFDGESDGGSCDNCGCDLDADDMGDLCDQCEWWVANADS